MNTYLIAGMALLVVVVIGVYYYYYSTPSVSAAEVPTTTTPILPDVVTPSVPAGLASNEVKITFYESANYSGNSQPFIVKRVGAYYFAIGSNCASGSTGIIGFKPNSIKIENYKSASDTLDLRGYYANPGDGACGPSAARLTGLPKDGALADVYATGIFGANNSSWIKGNVNGGYILTLGSA